MAHGLLPSIASAVISREKIVDYLLSLTHTYGSSKARFFVGFGFERETWQVLRDAIIRHAHDNEVMKIAETDFGTTYEIEGRLLSPDGRNPKVLVV